MRGSEPGGGWGEDCPLTIASHRKGHRRAGLLAQIIIDKFVDHLPFYRQARRFRRAGFNIRFLLWKAGLTNPAIC
ncbi:MAG: transposase [Bacteroidia bacterium]|nr:transposase [Bacteroidia bacterium]